MIASLDEQTARAREGGATMHHPLNEILRFYSLVLTSRNLVTEMEMAHAFAAARPPAKTA